VVTGIPEYICEMKDNSIWEVRKERQDFIYSKLMCWVAVDRGIRIAAKRKTGESPESWHQTGTLIRNAILERGFNRKLNSFVTRFDSDDLDATLLLIPLRGFLPAEDDRVQGTINAVMKYLMCGNGLVLRYKMEDGLPGREGAFGICSFWLVIALAISGRIPEAEELFQKILNYLGPLGLISEEIDPDSGKLLGNMPQAFSHIGLINAAIQIGTAKALKG